MESFLIALVVFICLFGAAMAALYTHHLLPEAHLAKETQDSIRLGIGMIVAVSALVLGLMTAWVQTSFSKVRSDVATFATELALLDDTLRDYGPTATPVRQDLISYLQRALSQTWPQNGQPVIVDDDVAEDLLHRCAIAIEALRPADDLHRQLAAQANTQIETLIQQRWTLIEEAGFSISPIMLCMVIFWLSVVFASFGYSAPRNRLVIINFVLCAVSISGAIFIIVKLADPFGGVIAISPQPLQITLHHMLRA